MTTKWSSFFLFIICLLLANILASCTFISPLTSLAHQKTSSAFDTGSNNTLDIDSFISFAFKNNIGKLMKMVLQGVDINSQNRTGDTALIAASSIGNIDTVNYLIAAGADVDIVGNHGATALLTAVINSHNNVIKVLLAANANPVRENSHSSSPLLEATANNDSTTIILLLNNGADIDQITNTGETALMRAAAKNNLNIVKLLLEQGANPLQQESAPSDFDSALSIALKSDFIHVVEEIENNFLYNFRINKTNTRLRQVYYQLALFYHYKQNGFPLNYARAARWYKLAAEQKHIGAAYILGKLYEGTQLSQDYSKAAKWYLAAARHGHADAQYRLGKLYAQGKGVPASKLSATDWFFKAGESYLKMDEKDKALRAADAIQQQIPNHYSVYQLITLIRQKYKSS